MRSRRSQEGDPNWAGIEALLKKRKGLLDGIVFSGGEPCMDPALPSAVRLVKDEGYLVGLHTSGAYPRHLKECIGLVDWVYILTVVYLIIQIALAIRKHLYLSKRRKGRQDEN